MIGRNKGHSSGNGEQGRVLAREIQALRREIRNHKSEITNRIDRAVALADQEVGIVSRGAPPVQIGAPVQTTATGEPPPFSAAGRIQSQTGQPLIAPYPLYRGISAPVPELPGSGIRDSGLARTPKPETLTPTDVEAKIAAGYTLVFGASGTPVVSGFLVDLGEYNPQMMGLNAVKIYEQMRRGDGQVYGILQAMMLPVKSARWELVPAEVESRKSKVKSSDSTFNFRLSTALSSTGAGKNTSAKAQEVCEFVKHNLFGGLETRTPRGGWVTQNFVDVLNIALRMLIFGCAVYEMVFTVDGDKLRLRRCADRQALTFYRWHTDPAVLDTSLPLGLYDDGETLIALQQYGYRAGSFITPLLPAEKIARFTFNQEGANFWGIPPTRAMYPHWYVKSALQRIDAIACERNSLGVPTILLPPGASKEDVAAAQNFVTQLAAHERTGITLPAGAEFKILGIEGRLRDILPSVEYQDMQMARAGLAMFMQLGGGTGAGGRPGTRALGKEQTDFFLLALQCTADHIASVIRNDTIKPLVKMNFGEGAPVPILKAANVQARTLEDVTDAISKLATAGAWVSDLDELNKNRHELGFDDLRREAVLVSGRGAQAGLQDWSAEPQKPAGATGNPSDDGLGPVA
jgi:hypothetical protein